ncbi:MAG: CTP synthase [Spirochaetia bacterium]|jgi:CTP synthase|nr:CTP synthase [Spirochaetia bacterium]
MSKYIFVTGGVCSSLGKGIAAASLGTLLESRGLQVRMMKADPYLNVDPGTMSPYQHGEVYVTADGAETDLDLGNYERFTTTPLTKANSMTTGQIYQSVIQKEREGSYLGRTVQVIPHITDEIKQRIFAIGESPDVDVTIIEIGGTVGDIESIPFLEAARQFRHDIGRDSVLYVHLTLVPEVIGGELKTKPTQHSVKALRELGIQPDILLCRTPVQMDEEMSRKIALFTNVDDDAVISAYDIVSTIYEIPLAYHRQNLDKIAIKKLGIEAGPADLAQWEKVVNTFKTATETVKIALVGKYIHLNDTYKSIVEALFHGAIANNVKVEIIKIDSEDLEKAACEKNEMDRILKGIKGILVPGGFGQRGIDGMVCAAKYAREKNIPYFGICLGMQIMVIEYARNVLEHSEANSKEFSPDTDYPVVSLLEEQIDIKLFGGTMRLGNNESRLIPGSKIYKAYGSELIIERHRHRFEFSNKFKDDFLNAGFIISGYTTDGSLVEAVEWKDHPWGVGVQFHPEFNSKPFSPHPLFVEFVKASKENEK